MGALSLIPGIGPVLDGIATTIKLFKDNGIIRTPEDEAKAQQILTDNAINSMQVYWDFLTKPTPDSADTPRWINGFIAITRPAMVWLVTSSIVAAFFIPGMADRVSSVLNSFGQAGSAGLAFLSIPILWISGRTIEKWTAMKTGTNGGISETIPNHPPSPTGNRGNGR